MYADNNGVFYKLNENMTATILKNNISFKIEIFPTIDVNGDEYEVVFPDDCFMLFNSLNLKEFKLHKLLHETTNITNAECMFGYCWGLTELDLTNLNTENVRSMKGMFVNCCGLTELNISNFNTKNVKSMKGMFYNNSKLIEIDISNFNTESLKSINNIFYKCSSLSKIYLPKIKKDISIEDFIYKCDSLKQLDLIAFKNEFWKLYSDNYRNIILANIELKMFNIYDVNCNNSYIE